MLLKQILIFFTFTISVYVGMIVSVYDFFFPILDQNSQYKNMKLTLKRVPSAIRITTNYNIAQHTYEQVCVCICLYPYIEYCRMMV